MFISIVLNTEYWDYDSRSKWYLKNLLHCKENGWILITHEYIRDHFAQMQTEISERLFREFEMRPFTADEITGVEQYIIPESVMNHIEKSCVSRTATLEYLVSDACPEIEHVFDQIIEQIKDKHPNERIEGMFNCLENFQFLRNISEKHEIPLISYSFSAIRRPHGYRQTLYHTGLDGYLYTSAECKAKYDAYLQKSMEDLPIFSNDEIIAIIGKDRTLPLLPLINMSPKYEMGICGESFAILPQFFNRNRYTDDDIFYECSKLYRKDQIDMRHHAAQLDLMRISRDSVHNDPAPYILSCKRLTAVRSQIMLKVLLWKRVAVVAKDTLAFSFMCEKDYTSNQIADIKALNYYIFGFLIPSGLMFSDAYWKWRMSNPTEHEIYRKHLDYILNELAIAQEIISKKGAERIKALLESRGCDEELINILLEDKHDFDIDYNTASSRIVVNGKSYWRLNKIENGVRHFHLELNESADNIDFYPLDDVAGCARLVSVAVNSKPVDVSNLTDFRYMPKVSGHYSLPFPPTADKTVIDIAWDYQSNNEFLNAHV